MSTEYIRAQIETHCILNEFVLVHDLTLLLSYPTYNHCYLTKSVALAIL